MTATVAATTKTNEATARTMDVTATTGDAVIMDQNVGVWLADDGDDGGGGSGAPVVVRDVCRAKGRCVRTDVAALRCVVIDRDPEDGAARAAGEDDALATGVRDCNTELDLALREAPLGRLVLVRGTVDVRRLRRLLEGRTLGLDEDGRRIGLLVDERGLGFTLDVVFGRCEVDDMGAGQYGTEMV